MTVVEIEGAKSVRERYIRVAAIDTMITEGSRNICVLNRYQSSPCIRTTRDIQNSMTLVFTAKFSSIYYSLTHSMEGNNTVQIQDYENLRCRVRG